MQSPVGSNPRSSSFVGRRARRARALVLLGALAGAGLIAPTASCSVHEHRVGLGPTGQGEETKRAWYLFFGLFRLNEVDTQRMAAGATSYAVRTERSFWDYVLAPLTLPLTITSRTVTVSK